MCRALDDMHDKTRKRKGESLESYQDRKDCMLEYSTYLQTVLHIQKKNVAGWALPSVWILNKDGEPENEEANVSKPLANDSDVECRPYRSRTCDTLIKSHGVLV